MEENAARVAWEVLPFPEFLCENTFDLTFSGNEVYCTA